VHVFDGRKHTSIQENRESLHGQTLIHVFICILVCGLLSIKLLFVYDIQSVHVHLASPLWLVMGKKFCFAVFLLDIFMHKGRVCVVFFALYIHV